MSKYSTYIFWFFLFALVNVFFAFPFSEFKRVQTKKLIVSPKIAFGVLFLTILYYLTIIYYSLLLLLLFLTIHIFSEPQPAVA